MKNFLTELFYDWIHWSNGGLYLFGWRVNSVKGFNAIEVLCIEKGIDPSWMYRRIYFIGCFILYWAKR